MANSKGLIPADVINEIKSKNDIVNYISSKQDLFKRGKNYHGKCPVCGKSKSFVVYPETTSFYCFACSLGGDIITYVMKTKKVDYKAAVSELASIAGTTLPEIKPSPNNLMRDAAKYYHMQLRANKNANKAIEQLHSWGLHGKNIVQLGIGFHDNSAYSFIEYMTGEKGYSLAQLEEAKLIARHPNGHYYDKMRNSIIFPTIDTKGNVVCFDHYRMDKKEIYKYPNGENFARINYIYSLNLAVRSQKKSVVIVSSYADYFKLFGFGVTNVVATYMPKIKKEQLDLLKKNFKVFITFVPPTADFLACYQYCAKENVCYEQIDLQGCAAPAEYLEKYGAGAIVETIEKLEEILSSYQGLF